MSLAVTVALWPSVVLAVVTEAVIVTLLGDSPITSSLLGMPTSNVNPRSILIICFRFTVLFSHISFCFILFDGHYSYTPVQAFLPRGRAPLSSSSSSGSPAFLLRISSLVGYFVGSTPGLGESFLSTSNTGDTCLLQKNHIFYKM